jgi:hypothetical protein
MNRKREIATMAFKAVMADKLEAQEINKELAGLLGICWHEMDDEGFVTLKDGKMFITCKRCNQFIDMAEMNPDFSSDAGKVQLLRLMEGRSDWDEFHCYALGVDEDNDLIPLGYITDTTGKLAKAALEWVKGEKR